MPGQEEIQFRRKYLERLLRRTIEDALSRDHVLSALNDRLADEGYSQISAKTLDLDIASLREMGADIAHKKIYGDFVNSQGRPTIAKTVLFYEDASFSVFEDRLSTADTEKVKAAVGILDRVAGSTLLAEAIPLIKKQLGGVEAEIPILFDQNDLYSGRKFIRPFFDAIMEKKALKVEYMPFTEGEVKHWSFSPYLIRQYNNRWYAIGKTPETDYYTNLALDRVVRVQTSSEPYFPTDLTMADWNDRFGEIIGVTYREDAPLELVRLRFHGSTGKYVLTKPLHITQHLAPDQPEGDAVDIQIEVKVNHELKQQIMFYGGEVEVIAPTKLRLEINEWHQKGIERNGNALQTEESPTALDSSEATQ
jgi:predicted DNA-binding transcriptional regulator YafY